MTAVPTSSPVLRFDTRVLKKNLAKARDNVSAIVLRGEHLWLGGDEGTSIDRMTRDADGFGRHVRFDLDDVLALPAPAKEEIDIEGLDVDDGYLWLIGSHSAKRKKADPDKSPSENLTRVSTVELDGNRFTLARVPLDDRATPVRAHRARTAARLDGDTSGNLLTAALLKDAHLGRFVPRVADGGAVRGVPSKDNGFDVEGLAVSGNRVFMGLRGPVLRGWALVLELQVSVMSPHRLTLDPLGPGGEPYRKHFLQLEGLGVRDLVLQGSDLLVLAGPSMDLDGPVGVYRWTGAMDVGADSMTWRDDLPRIVTVPFGLGADHAEGMTLVETDPAAVLVSFDSPSPARIDGADGSGVRADVYAVAG